jgi:hypothetical protein
MAFVDCLVHKTEITRAIRQLESSRILGSTNDAVKTLD